MKWFHINYINYWLLFNGIAQAIKFLNKQAQKIWKTIVAAWKESKNFLWEKVYENLELLLAAVEK